MLARLTIFLPLASALVLLSATPGAVHAGSTAVPTTASALPDSTAAADMPNMENRALACTGCHGEFGVATANGYFPRIAGKPAGYLFKQLQHFKSGARRFDAMNRLVKALPNEYLQQFATYFAELDLPYPAPVIQQLSAAQIKRAETLIDAGDPARNVPACKSCHGELLTGVQPDVPGLLGLPRDYLTAQLGAWKNDLRKASEPDCMASIVERLSLSDLTAVSGWLSAQMVPANSKAVSKEKHRQWVPKRPLPCGEEARADQKPISPVTELPPALVAGQYLSRLGNCAACHESSGKTAETKDVTYGGGVAINTPFGRVFGSNISSSHLAGVGDWTAEQFHRAMTEGVSANGTALNPVFPYQFFSGLQRADTTAMLRWLQASKPVDKPSLPHELRFPYGTSVALSVWRWLYVEAPSTSNAPEVTAKPSVERGRYLVETIMHCNACHGERNFMGGFSRANRTGGHRLPGDAGYAPSLEAAHEAGMADWTLEEIEAFLRTGHNRHADANGLMAQIVQNSTQYLNTIDLTSAAIYLKSGFVPSAPAEPLESSPSQTISTSSLALWRDNCASCHADDGQGKEDLGPPLAGRRSVQLVDATNVIISILHGGFGAATRSRPAPPGMPGFAHRLNDQQIARLASFVRRAWGNRGSSVRVLDVQRLR